MMLKVIFPFWLKILHYLPLLSDAIPPDPDLLYTGDGAVYAGIQQRAAPRAADAADKVVDTGES